MPSPPSALEYHVPKTASIRLDAYVLKVFAGVYSRSQAKKWIKAGHVTVNEKRLPPSYYPKLGDHIQLTIPVCSIPSYALALQIYHEDDHLAVVFKPAGLHVSGNYPRTLRRALRYNLQPSAIPYPLPHPEPAHRLDRRTSGLLLIAKTPAALHALSTDFAARRIEKKYRALVLGRAAAGSTCIPIDGKPAETHWRVVHQSRSLHTEYLTELAVFPRTGRTHQIRKHLTQAGHPILGDDLYHNGLVRTDKGLFLSATGLSFTHPATQTPQAVHIAPPEKFARYREREARRYQRYHGKET